MAVEHSTDFRVLVVGEVGDGKTALVKKLVSTADIYIAPENRNKWEEKKQKLVSGIASRGVTKELGTYQMALGISDREFIIDTPGIGDKDTNLMQLIGKIEMGLKHCKPNAIILVSQMAKMRMTLGAQVASSLVKLGIMANDPLAGCNVIVCGTQYDQIRSKSKRMAWKKMIGEDIESSLGSHVKVKIVQTALPEQENEDEEELNSKDDISELVQALKEIYQNHRVLTYKAPSEEKTIEELGKATGLDLESPEKVKRLEKDLSEARKKEEKLMKMKLKNGLLQFLDYIPIVGSVARFVSGDVDKGFENLVKDVAAIRTLGISKVAEGVLSNFKF